MISDMSKAQLLRYLDDNLGVMIELGLEFCEKTAIVGLRHRAELVRAQLMLDLVELRELVDGIEKYGITIEEIALGIREYVGWVKRDKKTRKVLVDSIEQDDLGYWRVRYHTKSSSKSHYESLDRFTFIGAYEKVLCQT